MVLLEIQNQSPLIRAIFSDSLSEVKRCLEENHDVNELDPEKRSALHAASFKASKTIASLLVTSGARVNAKDKNWATPFHIACAVDAHEVINVLVESDDGVELNPRDRQWRTPLHIAAANNSEKSMELLLGFVSNVNVTDRAGWTALHYAAAHGHVSVTSMLLDKGANVNACDKRDCRPLHYAVHNANYKVALRLLRQGADVNAKDRNQYTALHLAVDEGVTKIRSTLLSYGAAVDAQNVYGNTPLHLACITGCLSMCQILVEYKANLEAMNSRGQTPLHFAASSLHVSDLLPFLVMLGVDVNKQSDDGRTPLHMTAIHGTFTRSRTLIDAGAIVDCKDRNGCTPLHIAAQNGYDFLTSMLLAYNANPSERGYDGRTPLHMCCMSGYVECCRKLIQVGVDINVADDAGKTPLHYAAFKGSAECLDLLVSNSADIHCRDSLLRLPLHYAALRGHYQCLFTLVGLGSATSARDHFGRTPLHLAAAHDCEGKCVEYLLLYRADPKVQDSDGFTALHYAVSGGNAGAVRALLQAGAMLDVAGAGGVTSLHLASKLGHEGVLEIILDYYHDVNVKTDKGYTPLILAAREGHCKCVKLLLRYGANASICDNVYNMTPMHYSAQNGNPFCLTFLLQNGCHEQTIDAVDKYHRTPLMLAISGNFVQCAEILLKWGADPNIHDLDKHSALFRAVVNGQNRFVELLLAKNAVINDCDINGKTVVHLAASSCLTNCLEIILSHMDEKDILILDSQGFSALHWACYNGRHKCLDLLVNRKVFKTLEGNPFSPVHCASFAGSETCLRILVDNFGDNIVNLKDTRQRTPLHIAALHGHVNSAKLLLEKGAQVEAVDEDGRTPFIAASQYGQSQIIELLLANNVNKTAVDKQGNTALHWACLKKHSYTALIILEHSSDTEIINMSNNESKSPLHLAARNGLVDVTRELLQKGSSVLAVDKDGYTPALCCASNNNVAQCLGLILRNLSELNTVARGENDSLLTFFELVSSKLKSSTSSQTALTLLRNPDFFEMKRLFKTKSPPKFTKPPESNGEQSSESIFLIETEDFNTGYVPEPKNKAHGLSLHRSYSDMSIPCGTGTGTGLKRKSVQSGLCELVERKKNCHECFRLQQRCNDCTIKYVLRRYSQGKMSAASFNDYIVRSLGDASPDFRNVFLKVIEAMKRETIVNERRAFCCGRSPVPVPSVKFSIFNRTRLSISRTDDEEVIVMDPENVISSSYGSVRALETDVRANDDGNSKVLGELKRAIRVFEESLIEFRKNINEEIESEEKIIEREESRATKDSSREDGSEKCSFSLSEEFLNYLKSIKLGSDKSKDKDYFAALSSYMSYMLQKFDRDFELQKELEQNYKSCAKYQQVNFALRQQDSFARHTINKRQPLRGEIINENNESFDETKDDESKKVKVISEPNNVNTQSQSNEIKVFNQEDEYQTNETEGNAKIEDMEVQVRSEITEQTFKGISMINSKADNDNFTLKKQLEVIKIPEDAVNVQETESIQDVVSENQLSENDEQVEKSCADVLDEMDENFKQNEHSSSDSFKSADKLLSENNEVDETSEPDDFDPKIAVPVPEKQAPKKWKFRDSSCVIS